MKNKIQFYLYLFKNNTKTDNTALNLKDYS